MSRFICVSISIVILMSAISENKIFDGLNQYSLTSSPSGTFYGSCMKEMLFRDHVIRFFVTYEMAPAETEISRFRFKLTSVMILADGNGTLTGLSGSCLVTGWRSDGYTEQRWEFQDVTPISESEKGTFWGRYVEGYFEEMDTCQFHFEATMFLNDQEFSMLLFLDGNHIEEKIA